MCHTFAKKPQQKQNKTNDTHKKTHTKAKKHLLLVAKTLTPRRNREDIEKLAAEFPAICDAFFCFFLSFVAENVLSKMKSRNNLKESEQIYKKHFLFLFFL